MKKSILIMSLLLITVIIVIAQTVNKPIQVSSYSGTLKNLTGTKILLNPICKS